MKINVGSRVKFLNDVGEGIVSEIIDDKIVKVTIDDGFDIPIPIKELLLINDEEYNTNEKKQTFFDTNESFSDKKKIDVVQLPVNVSQENDINVMIGLVPNDLEDIHHSEIDMFLINDSNYTVSYLIGYSENISFLYLASGLLEGNTKIFVSSFDQTKISKIKRINLQVLFLSQGNYIPKQPINKYFAVDHFLFYKKNVFKENNYFDEDALIFEAFEKKLLERINEITDEQINESIQKKEENKIVNEKKTGSSVLIEVDLHIHELIDNYKDLSDWEIVNVQMEKFRTSLEEAIDEKIRKIIFIHGVGKGKLKYELRKELEERFPDLKYQDASFREYGYGATLVNLL